MMLYQNHFKLALDLLKFILLILLSNIVIAEDFEILKQNDPELLADAIYEISSQVEESYNYVINDEIKQKLVQLLSHEDEGVRGSASYFFEQLANRHDALDKPLADALLLNLKQKRRGTDSIANVIGLLGGPNYIPALVEVMGSSDIELRQALVETLGEIGHEDALPALFKALEHSNEDVRILAVEAIENIDHKNGVKPLIEALSDKSEYVQHAAAIALGELNDKRAVEPIIAYIKKTDADDRSIKALEKLNDPRAIPFLVDSLNKDQFYDETAVQAIRTLRKLNGEKEAFDALVNISKNKNYDSLVRITAMTSLGNTKNHRATHTLLSLLLNDKESSLIRQYAAKGLGILDDRKAIGALSVIAFETDNSKTPIMEWIMRLFSSEYADLMKRIRLDQNSDIIKEAVLALGMLEHKGSVGPLLSLLREGDSLSLLLKINIIEALGLLGATKATKPLLTLLNDKDKYVRQTAVKALEKINSNHAIPVLISVLQKDKHEYVRANAAKALGKTKNPDVIPALLASLNDSDSSVTTQSKVALVEIADPNLVEQFIQTLLSEKEAPEYRKEIIQIIAHFNQPNVIDALLISLKSKHYEIRYAAVGALEMLSAEEAADEIFALLTDEENEFVYSNAMSALAKFGDHRVIPLLINALNDTGNSSLIISGLCIFKQEPRAAKKLAHYSRNGSYAYLRKKTRCESL